MTRLVHSTPQRFLRPPAMSLAVFAALVSVALMLVPGALFAQSPDSKGKEFWVTFLENFGSGGEGEISDLRLYASCDRPTSLLVVYNATLDSIVIQVPTPNVPVEINVNSLFGNDVELDGVDWNDQNVISSKSILVESQDDITLYGVNIRSKSADAFLSLPYDVLTGRYIVLGYTNGYSLMAFGSEFDRNSEFAIVGTEDGTTVRITPSAPMNGRTDLTPLMVNLDRGEVFLGQSNLDGPHDVSGTEIRSNKPVALFAGTERTAVPTNVGNYRDHLVEQIPPIDAWGLDAILTPHFDITPQSTIPAIARVIAALDNTDVSITTTSGTNTFQLAANQVLDIEPLEAAYVSANQPILVAQYEGSVNADDIDGEPLLGDPFMMVIPMPAQFDTAYAFQSVIHPEFRVHYVNIIVPAGAEQSIVLDDVPVSGAVYEQVPGSNYLYTQLRVTPGSHFIRADQPFGLDVYGYGPANSYGYTGGTLFRTLVSDTKRPEINTFLQCGDLRGFAIDGGLTDLGIDSVYVIPEQSQNANVSVEQFESGDDTVGYSVRLVDPYQDGTVTVKTIDLAGRSWTSSNTIPGFTVRATGMNGSIPETDTAVSWNGGTVCTSVTLTNYGSFDQTISNINLRDALAGTVLSPDTAITLTPGETRVVQICFNPTGDTNHVVGLVVGDSCRSRDVYNVAILSMIDTAGPQAEVAEGPCGDEGLVTISEGGSEYHGVRGLTIDRLENGTAEFVPDTTELPRGSAAIRFKQIDFREDLVYSVTATDMAGNNTTIDGVIPGFSLSLFEQPNGERLSQRLGTDWRTEGVTIKGRTCDSILLTNHGSQTIDVVRVQVRENVEFSIPPSQLPVVLEPGGSRWLEICFEGNEGGENVDTLLIWDGCGRWEAVLLKAQVDDAFGTGVDACNQRIGVRVTGPTKRTFLTAPTPNPTTGAEVSVDLGLMADERVSLDLLDMKGNRALHILDGVSLEPGVHRVAFSALNLDNGLYLCRMTTASGEVLSTKVVVKR